MPRDIAWHVTSGVIKRNWRTKIPMFTPTAPINVNGASLIVFFDDGNPATTATWFS